MKPSLCRVLIVTLCLMISTACTPARQSFLPATQIPHFEAQSIVAVDGMRLPLYAWLPAGKPTAVVIALHGFGDYSHSFHVPGTYLSARGIAVLAYDQRGFGRTQPFGIWAREENLIRDLQTVIRLTEQRYPGIPVYVLGASMGGAVAILTATSPDTPPFAGVILAAPAVWGGGTFNPFLRAMAWTMAHSWPGKKVTGSGLHVHACDNEAVLREMYYDPYVIKATRIDSLYGLVEIMDDAYDAAPRLQVPTLILYGAHDQVIPAKPVLKTYRALEGRATMVYYPNGYHMVLRDRDADIVLGDIAAWINHVTPLPSGDTQNAVSLEKSDNDTLDR